MTNISSVKKNKLGERRKRVWFRCILISHLFLIIAINFLILWWVTPAKEDARSRYARVFIISIIISLAFSVPAAILELKFYPIKKL